MPNNPFESPQVDLTSPDGPPSSLASDGRLTLASFGARAGGKIGALLGLLGGAALSTALGATYSSMELGGRPGRFGVEIVFVGALFGAALSWALGAIVGAWLGGLCERRPERIGRTANWLGAIASAIGAATYTAIGAGLVFDIEPFNESQWPRTMIAACGAFAGVLGAIGGTISARRIAAYAGWQREVAVRYGNSPK